MAILTYFIKLIFKSDQSNLTELVQRSSKLMLVQVGGAILLLLNNFVVIKVAGDLSYGTYVSIAIWINLFSVLAIFGMDDRFISSVPKYIKTSYEKTIYNILFWGLKIVFLFFPLVCLILFLLVKNHYLQVIANNHTISIYILLLVVTILNILVQFLISADHLLLSQILDKLIRTVLVISIVLLLPWISNDISAFHLIIVQTFSVVCCIGYISYFLYRTKLKASFTEEHNFNKKLQPNLYFLAISLLSLLAMRLDVLFLSATVNPTEVGHYNIAMRFADIIHYPVSILNLIVPALISKSLFADDSSKKFYTIIKNASLISLAGTAIILLGMVVFSERVLDFFGKGFIGGYEIIILLGISYVLVAFFGPLNALFMVSNREYISLYCQLMQLVSIVVGCIFLVPIYKVNGAAYAVIIGNLTYLVAITFFFYRSEKVFITPFKIFRF